MNNNSQPTTRQKLRMTYVFTAFMFVLGAANFYGLCDDLHRASFREVQGKVVQSSQYTGSSKVAKARVPKLLTDVEYTYKLDGKEHTKMETSEWISDLEARNQFAPGQPITIYVNPNDAREATMEKARDFQTDLITMWILGVATLIGALESVRLIHKIRKETVIAA